jgi:hypothetical protein
MKTPNTLDEAIEALTLDFRPEEIECVKLGEYTPTSMHHGLGRWLRNNWGLWGGSNLRTHFFDMGVHHADDMSDIILTKFIAKVKDQPFDLQVKLDKLKSFWKDQNVDVDAEIERLRNE